MPVVCRRPSRDSEAVLRTGSSFATLNGFDYRREAAMGAIHSVPSAFAGEPRVTREQYQRLYADSVHDPETFWKNVAQRLDWIRSPAKIKDVSFDARDLHIRWYEDGVLNVAVNCLDRHLATRGDKTAILFEGDDPGESAAISYRELHAMVCRFGNALRNLGVGKGDRVAIYMPMIPEAAVAMLACARIGAVHSVVFGGFSPDRSEERRVGKECRSRWSA